MAAQEEGIIMVEKGMGGALFGMADQAARNRDKGRISEQEKELRLSDRQQRQLNDELSNAIVRADIAEDKLDAEQDLSVVLSVQRRALINLIRGIRGEEPYASEVHRQGEPTNDWLNEVYVRWVEAKIMEQWGDDPERYKRATIEIPTHLNWVSST